MSTIDAIRDLAGDFPTLQRRFDGRPVAYLDSAATSQTPQVVIDAMTRYYT
jgi:cysteine desulfurase / selenocysteine lyase